MPPVGQFVGMAVSFRGRTARCVGAPAANAWRNMALYTLRCAKTEESFPIALQKFSSGPDLRPLWPDERRRAWLPAGAWRLPTSRPGAAIPNLLDSVPWRCPHRSASLRRLMLAKIGRSSMISLGLPGRSPRDLTTSHTKRLFETCPAIRVFLDSQSTASADGPVLITRSLVVARIALTCVRDQRMFREPLTVERTARHVILGSRWLRCFRCERTVAPMCVSISPATFENRLRAVVNHNSDWHRTHSVAGCAWVGTFK